MIELHFPWIECAILASLIGAAIAAPLTDARRARRVALVAQSVSLLSAIGAWIDFNDLHVHEAHDLWGLSRFLFGKDLLVIDELSAPLLPLVALLYLLTTAVTLRTKVNRFSFAWNLVGGAATLGALGFQEPWLVIALVIASAIPPGIELRRRGKSVRVYAIHMTLMSFAFVAGQALIDAEGRFGPMSTAAAALLALGVFIRAGLFPFHVWLTDLFERASFGTALLVAVSMLGDYAALRLVLPSAPEWTLRMLGIGALVTAVYAAGMTLVQTEARRFFCFLFLSASALTLAGLESGSSVGLTGGLCVWLSVALAMGGFGLTLRAIESREGRLSLVDFHGMHDLTPMFAAFFLITGLASVGFPGTIGFLGSEMLLDGAVQAYPLVGLCVLLASALNGVAVMKAYFAIFGGRRQPGAVSLAARPRERFAKLALTLLLLGGAFIPQAGVASRRHAAEELLRERAARVATSPPAELARK
jgi:NADH-quinone oxidoreductase subunit M